jgi:hypothetical protein
MLTIFGHCGYGYFSSRTTVGAVPATKCQRFWPRIFGVQGSGMLIRGKIEGVEEGAAKAEASAIPAASLPTLLIGGLLLLICP